MGKLYRYLDDILVLSGCIAILYGVYLLNPLAVWFVGGGMLITTGVMVGMEQEKDKGKT
jgi:hypothetical protein